MKLRLRFLQNVSSTQLLMERILKPNLCIYTHNQTQGIGSRGNSWECVQSGLYFSLCLNKAALPPDLPPQSASIYFGFHFKEILKKLGFSVFLKWPNDIYIKDKKIGGIIVHYKNDLIIIGIGINYKVARNSGFGELGKKLNSQKILQKFFKNLGLKETKNNKNSKNFKQKTTKISQKSWKQTFMKYKLEFQNNFSFHNEGKLLDLRGAILCEDGAIALNGQRFYSLR
ncbi:MAG: biotin--[acetyl-CoA-carboxylase] ligase [Helicobacter sp.]|mgnify:CR=1 FL=1|nr:biotin--[acetyl-CoA-carboxylase] ligase [Helicobacter sp.]